MENSRNSSFSMQQLLGAVGLVTIPIALYASYWRWANNTVDQTTIPLGNLGLGGQILFGLAALSMVVITCWGIYILLKRKMYLVFACAVGVLCFAGPFFARVVESNVVSPEQGNQSASLHNDACSIVSIAVSRHFSKTNSWPTSWNDLQQPIEDVLGELHQVRIKGATTTGPFTGFDPSVDAEQQQGIFNRLPDTSSLDVKALRELVDIDFDAKPEILNQQKWHEFTGVVPHKPTYNFYRVEVSILIDELRKHDQVK